MEKIRQEIKRLMRENRRSHDGFQYTLPSPELYPFQWLWDSCFHAIILSHFDIEAAKNEIRSVLSRPLPSGLLPHIIYWKSHDAKIQNWGREMRGDIINASWKTDGTSSITQPPVIAYAIWRIYNTDNDTEFLSETYKTLRDHFECLNKDRTFGDDHLVYIINPDESGEDNSPRFDRALGLAPKHTPDENLDHRISLMRDNASCNFEAKACMDDIFGIADVPFNTLYINDLEHMALIAEALGHEDDKAIFSTRADAVRHEMEKDLKDGILFRSYDNIHKEHGSALTWAIFMPLYSKLLSTDDARELVDTYFNNDQYFDAPYDIPTTARNEEAYDPKGGFWRGPVWMAPNWFTYHGLKKYGFDDEAKRIKESSRALVERSGFREQYDPETGEGLGAHNFTWGGLIIDM